MFLARLRHYYVSKKSNQTLNFCTTIYKPNIVEIAIKIARDAMHLKRLGN